MQYTNCPRCGAPLAAGMQLCPNCQLDVHQYFLAQQVPLQYQRDALVESKKEKQYRLLLLGIIFLILGQFTLIKAANWIMGQFTLNAYSFLLPVYWVVQIAWSVLPVLIAFMFPKKYNLRTLFIVLTSLYAVWNLGVFVYGLFARGNPFVGFQF